MNEDYSVIYSLRDYYDIKVNTLPFNKIFPNGSVQLTFHFIGVGCPTIINFFSMNVDYFPQDNCSCVFCFETRVICSVCHEIICHVSCIRPLSNDELYNT